MSVRRTAVDMHDAKYEWCTKRTMMQKRIAIASIALDLRALAFRGSHEAAQA